MYIPLKREDIEIIPYKGIFESVDKNIINKWTYQYAEIAYECLLKGQENAKIDFKNTQDEGPNGIILNISWDNLLKTSGRIDGLDDKGFLKITIFFNKDSLEKGKEECIKDVYNVISREMMYRHF